MTPTQTKIAAAIARHIEEPLIIFLVNFGGGAGKTTLGRHLVVPAFADADFIHIENLNSTGESGADLSVKAKAINQVVDLMNRTTKPLVIDIGASAIEAVLNSMRKMMTLHERVDMILIPSTPDAKLLEDTVATIKAFIELDVEPSKISLVKNKVVDIDSMEADFAVLTSVAKALGVRMVDRPVLEFDLYQHMQAIPGTVNEVALDTTDYRALIAQHQEAGDKKSEAEASAALTRQLYSQSAAMNLAKVRAELFGNYL